MDTKRIHTEEVVKLCPTTSLITHVRVSLCAVSSSSSPVPQVSTSFLPQISLQTTGPIVFTKMPSNPRPSMPVHGECVCVYMHVPVREQLSHSAITCCTADTDHYSPPSICLPLFPFFLSQNFSNFLPHTSDNPSLLSLILLTSHFIPSVQTE